MARLNQAINEKRNGPNKLMAGSLGHEAGAAKANLRYSAADSR